MPQIEHDSRRRRDMGESHPEVRKARRRIDVAAMPADQLLTISEVCGLLKVSRSTVFRIRQRGRLDSVMVEGCRHFRSTDVQAFIGGTVAE